MAGNRKNTINKIINFRTIQISFQQSLHFKLLKKQLLKHTNDRVRIRTKCTDELGSDGNLKLGKTPFGTEVFGEESQGFRNTVEYSKHEINNHGD